MAHVTTVGLKNFYNDLKSFGDDTDEIIVKMLSEGAAVAETEWQKGIQNEEHRIVAKDGKGFISKRGYIDTGDMLNSFDEWENGYEIDPKRKKVEIYPRGYDRKGVPNAEKAFVLNYGTSHYQGSRFVDDINDKVEIEAPVAMGHVMDEYLKKHNLT